jgi:NAD(P)-dependent dehydrogenase (short-subunit alcohol dehydrogenase family)
MKSTFASDLLKGKVAYVAGGTRGMNLAIARAYGRHGARVVVVSRDPGRCEQAEALFRADGTEARAFACDVRDEERVKETLKAAFDAYGPLDVVVAGQAGNFYAPVTGLSSKGFKAVIDIDLVGTFHVWKASWEYLRKPGASLLAITAPEAERALHFQAHVCAAKAGVNQLVRVFALEWGADGVRTNGISPGPIEGSWGMANVASPTPELVEMIRRAVPQKRWGREEDIAGAALFLASPAASFINGVILEVDGGVTISSPETSRFQSAADLERDPRVRRR